jgi:hypothetical protein
MLWPQGPIWVKDEGAEVDVYVLNPCSVPIPREPDQFLILALDAIHRGVAVGGTAASLDGDASPPAATAAAQSNGDTNGASAAATAASAAAAAAQPVVKSFQVQVPAALNLKSRSVADFASKGKTTLKLRPRETGHVALQVRLALCCASLPRRGQPQCVASRPAHAL